MAVLPQFPLQTVLLPGMPLQLQVFEPRYVELLNDVDGGEAGHFGEFGVVLITRGSEVGGDDQRADVGTVARITTKNMLAEGLWVVEARATDRFRVVGWMADDPYPKADVELWPATLAEQDLPLLASVTREFSRFLELASELGADVSGVGEVDGGMPGLYRMAQVIPITAYDRFRILAATSGGESVNRLADALSGVTELLRHQLSGGDS